MGINSLKGWDKKNPERRKKQQAELYLKQKSSWVLWRQQNPEKHKEFNAKKQFVAKI